MENNRYRNSPISMLMGIVTFISIIWTLIIIFTLFNEENQNIAIDVWLILIGVSMGALILLLIPLSINWKNTFYTLSEDSILWEYDGKLRKEQKELKYEYISSLNIKRNILHRLFRVMSVGFNLKSSATAHAEEFKLVLSKENMLRLQSHIDSYKSGQKDVEVVASVETAKELPEQREFSLTILEYFLNLWISNLFMALAIAFEVWMLTDADDSGGFGVIIVFVIIPTAFKLDKMIRNRVSVEDDYVTFSGGLFNRNDRKLSYDNIVSQCLEKNRVIRKYRLTFMTIGETEKFTEKKLSTLYMSKSKIQAIYNFVESKIQKDDKQEIELTLKPKVKFQLPSLVITAVIGATISLFVWYYGYLVGMIFVIIVVLFVVLISVIACYINKMHFGKNKITRVGGLVVASEENFDLEDVNVLSIDQGFLARLFKYAAVVIHFYGFVNVKSIDGFEKSNANEVEKRFVEYICK